MMLIVAPYPSTFLSALCRQHRMWGMYASVSDPEVVHEELLKAAPWAAERDALWNLTAEGGVYLIFSNEAEMLTVYEQTVGDDGPTKTNSYDGPVRVYALTCDPEGNTLNENT